MRVMHIITRMIIGGAQENTLYNCLDLLQEYGDEVLLVTGPQQGPEGGLLQEGRVGGLAIETTPSLIRNIQPLADWRAYRQLKSQIKRYRPDVVHTHSAKAGLLGRAAAWQMKVPAVIHTVHGAPFHPYQSAIARKFFVACERWAAGRCHHMISVADAMTDLMVAAGVAPRAKFTTIYSGMKVEPFQQSGQYRAAARRELGIAEDQIVFGKIARLFPLKGHEYLIEAARSLVKQCPQARILLVGDGILRRQLQAQIVEQGLQATFIFAGLVQPERIPYYMSAMDALVHTSLREGLARTLPQALIAGLPVISYDIDGAREVVLPGETGFLIKPQAIEELSAAMLSLARDNGLRTRLGQGGARRFTDQFRHTTMTRQIRELYGRFV
ncbi:MAG: glycosyltransferase family 4 protein [Pirellulaceae bacterium]|nr:glycosyltransferase family 4 protein [Pirellulaceae bacterium]